MAWVTSLDTFDPKHLGEDGSAVIGSERTVYYTEDTAITNYDVTDSASTWKKIHHIDEFNASDSTNKIEVYDGKTQTETKEGRTSSEMSIKQTYKGFLNSIAKLKSKQLWFAECLTDDRSPVDASGNPNFYEIFLVQGTLTNITYDKGDAEAIYACTGDGSYNVASQKRLFAKITPAGGVTLTPDGGATATAGNAKNFTITALDFKDASIPLTDLDAAALMGEITSINIKKKSGTPTISVADGANDATKAVTFTGTGECVVYAEIVTANGGTFASSDVTITVS